jgi:hypothetical protein
MVALLGIAFSIFCTSSAVTSRSFAGDSACKVCTGNDKHHSPKNAMPISFRILFIFIPFIFQ